MNDNKNTILAIVLSALVLVGWQFFVGMPQEKARQEQVQTQQQKQGAPTPAQPGQAPPAPAQQSGTPQVPGQAAAPSPAAPVNRAAALAASPRVPIATDNVQGSIALKGGRIDDLALVRFRETVDPKSPNSAGPAPAAPRSNCRQRKPYGHGRVRAPSVSEIR
jgi:YidC/Oxa1 family membrane protein insertase